MDPTAVAAFYRAKGYTVREGVRVPGLSGNEHKVPLYAEGPLGSLAIFFGDFGGVDGPEMGGARKAARDIGATPVLAADEFSNADRQTASRLGVVLLDGSMMAEEPAPPAPSVPPSAAWPGLQVRKPMAREETVAHPWPASGRSDGAAHGPAGRIDIDDLLAETRPRPGAARAASAPAATEAMAMEAVAAPSSEPGASPDPPGGARGQRDDGDQLWSRPRSAAAGTPAPPSSRAPSAAGKKFAWLGGEAASSATGAPLSPGEPAGYDGVVAARSRDAPPLAPGPELDATPRLGEETELAPTLEQLERKRRRDRLSRRLFWLLFLVTMLYTLWAFWNGKIGN